MSRPLRIEAPGEFFHVLARGNGRERIFVDDEDRCAFLDLVAESVDRFSLACHAYCLMGNHYHLIVQPSRANLSVTMRFLNGEYARHFNRRHRRNGHVFEGRFKSLLVDRDVYLMALARYIVLNPVRAGLVRSPDEWPWSSYRAMVGLVGRPRLLSTEFVLEMFGDRPEDAARRAFEDFVARAEPGGSDSESLAELTEGGAIAGSEEFIRRFESSIHAAQDDREHPGRHRYAGRPSLETQFKSDATPKDFALAVRTAHERHGYTLTEIAAATGVSVSTLSRVLRGYRTEQPEPRTSGR